METEHGTATHWTHQRPISHQLRIIASTQQLHNVFYTSSSLEEEEEEEEGEEGEEEEEGEIDR
jgi:hypothetical protein